MGDRQAPSYRPLPHPDGRPLLLRGIRQLLTFRGAAGPRRGAEMAVPGLVEDACLIVEGTRISEVGPARRIENLAIARRAIPVDLKDRVVIPAFVDPLCRPVSGLPLSVSLDRHSLPGTGSSEEFAGQRLQALRTLSATSLTMIAERMMLRALRHGIATMEGRTGAAGETSAQARLLHALQDDSLSCTVCPTFDPLFHLSATRVEKLSETIRLIAERDFPLIQKRRLAAHVALGWREDIPHHHYETLCHSAFSWGLAVRLEAGPVMTPSLVELVMRYGCRTVDRIKVISAPLAVALARTSAVLCMTPTWGGDAPKARSSVRHLMNEGAAIALATGFDEADAMSNSMALVNAMACGQYRMTPAEALTASTINAAAALGLANSVGSLEFGKQADLVVLEANDYREMTYFTGSDHIYAVMRQGKWMLQPRPEMNSPPNDSR